MLAWLGISPLSCGVHQKKAGETEGRRGRLPPKPKAFARLEKDYFRSGGFNFTWLCYKGHNLVGRKRQTPL
jgi:hypothetical protein